MGKSHAAYTKKWLNRHKALWSLDKNNQIVFLEMVNIPKVVRERVAIINCKNNKQLNTSSNAASIRILSLDRRINNILFKNNVFTLYDLTTKSEGDLIKMGVHEREDIGAIKMALAKKRMSLYDETGCFDDEEEIDYSEYDKYFEECE